MSQRTPDLAPVPRLCGADIELGNFVLADDPVEDSCRLASRAILEEIPGISRMGDSCSRGFNENLQDWGRKYLPLGGGCVYIDLDHLELCVPECLSAFDHTAAWHALLRVTQDAVTAANVKQPEGRRIQVL